MGRWLREEWKNERKHMQRTAQENCSPNPLTGKKDRVSKLSVFYEQQSTEFDVLEVSTIAMVMPDELSGPQVGSNMESPEHQSMSKDPLDPTGRRILRLECIW